MADQFIRSQDVTEETVLDDEETGTNEDDEPTLTPETKIRPYMALSIFDSIEKLSILAIFQYFITIGGLLVLKTMT